MKRPKASTLMQCETQLATPDGMQRERFGDFLCITAHEMRAPLQTIYGFARLLGSGLPPAEFDHYLRLIQQDTDRLMAMVDDLGWRGVLERGTLQFKLAACEVEPLLLSLSREVEREYSHCYVELVYDELPAVYADPDRLKDILQTLLRNAARYSPRTNCPIRFSVRPLLSQGQMEFSVRDLGVCILERYREKIFEPVVRLPRYLHRPGSGLGLGLYVARELARRMNGDLWLKSPARAGKKANGRQVGNEFVLHLPLAVTEATHV